MKKTAKIAAILGIAVLFSVSMFAQGKVTRGLKGNYDTSKFPEVSFEWNSPNPQVFNESQFSLVDENDKPIDFKLEKLGNSQAAGKLDKSILILWEDMASHKGQYDFAKDLLKSFLSGTTFSPNDKFNIAVFNRKKDSKPTVNEYFYTGYTTDTKGLISQIDKYAPSNESFSKYKDASDLYYAINEGIEDLKQKEPNRACFIVVITAGLNIKSYGSTAESGPTERKALEAGIPVYVIKYPKPNDTPEVNALADNTYGQHTSSTDSKAALANLQSYYKSFDERYYGNDYKITFTTDAKRDGKPHTLKMSVNKIAQSLPSFTAPDRTFWQWVADNIWLCILIIVAIILIVLLSVMLIRRRMAERDKEIAENEAAMQQKLQQSNQEMEQLKRNQEQQQQEYEQERLRKEAEAMRKAKEENDMRLLNLMQTKNLCPRLQCSVPGSSSFVYSISKPYITIGRNDNNDVVLSNKTVSGYHADIVFNGATFDLVNKSQSYTRGVIVNGQFFQQCTLKNGDIIGLGEAVITFYM